jgi:putative transposase
MASKEHYHTKFEAGKTYHVYNRSVDRAQIFATEQDIHDFLRRLNRYVSPYVEVYAWCILPNHFHWMIKVKEQDTFQAITKIDAPDVHHCISDGFRRAFATFAMRHNTLRNRHGAVFCRSFKRSVVEDEMYFGRLIYYIHANPQRHRVCADFRDYRWSSFQSYLSEKPTQLLRDVVWDFFGGKEAFQRYHDELHASIASEYRIEIEED